MDCLSRRKSWVRNQTACCWVMLPAGGGATTSEIEGGMAGHWDLRSCLNRRGVPCSKVWAVTQRFKKRLVTGEREKRGVGPCRACRECRLELIFGSLPNKCGSWTMLSWHIAGRKQAREKLTIQITSFSSLLFVIFHIFPFSPEFCAICCLRPRKLLVAEVTPGQVMVALIAGAFGMWQPYGVDCIAGDRWFWFNFERSYQRVDACWKRWWYCTAFLSPFHLLGQCRRSRSSRSLVMSTWHETQHAGTCADRFLAFPSEDILPLFQVKTHTVFVDDYFVYFVISRSFLVIKANDYEMWPNTPRLRRQWSKKVGHLKSAKSCVKGQERDSACSAVQVSVQFARCGYASWQVRLLALPFWLTDRMRCMSSATHPFRAMSLIRTFAFCAFADVHKGIEKNPDIVPFLSISAFLVAYLGEVQGTWTAGFRCCIHCSVELKIGLVWQADKLIWRSIW